jgi:hypothetical protein
MLALRTISARVGDVMVMIMEAREAVQMQTMPY